ncbi:MAG: dTDP-glucose 4,6-dehydratase [Bacteroidia bacterium]|nr:dTDP-glucose 4,6-dehydratase [Bacteroidia bacterium]
MKILIIGSEGFIGKAAFDYFSSTGNDTWGCDIKNASAHVSKNFISVDSRQPNFTNVFGNQQFDCCLNASGAANVGLSIADPSLDFELNTRNVFLMLKAVKENNPDCKFLNLSSAAVYGNPLSLPVNEMQPVQPLSPYGWHKYMSELICKEFHTVYKLQTFSIRIFSAYGPGLRKQLFWDLYQKSLVSKNIELFGTGKESRDFIFIADLIQAIELVFKNVLFDGGVMNVANGTETTVENAASSFYKSLDKNTSFLFTKKKKEGDPDFWKADISKLLSLGYKQKYIFEQGINEYVKWLKENE